MISLKIDSRSFMKKMNNIVEYSAGFLDGVERGKTEMLQRLGREAIETIKQYVDSSARVSPGALHHVYEWYRVGSPDARLFDINYTVTGIGLSINSTFSQSRTVKAGSKVPFYDKARVMEEGIAVTIKPKTATVLSFDDNGEQVFTKKEISVSNPGGEDVAGAFERTFDSFMRNYFSQAFLSKSGILAHLNDASVYKKNLAAGSKLGRPKGVQTGYKWITSVGSE